MLTMMMNKKKDSRHVRPLKGGSTDDGGEQSEWIPKGHVPLMVGKQEISLKRFVVPIGVMKDPSIVALLRLSAERFGYCHQGVIQIYCDPHCFEGILGKLSQKR